MFASVCCAPESDEFTFNFKSNYFLPPLELSCSNLFKNKPLNEKKNPENERANVCASEREINNPLTFIFLLCLSLSFIIRVEFDSFAWGNELGLQQVALQNRYFQETFASPTKQIVFPRKSLMTACFDTYGNRATKTNKIKS